MRHAVNKSCAAAKSGCERLSLTIIVAMSVTSWGTTRHIPDVFGFLKLWACPDNADYPVETMRLSVLLSPPVIGLLALATSLVALGTWRAHIHNVEARLVSRSQGPRPDENHVLTTRQAVLVPVIASVTLLLFFFVFKMAPIVFLVLILVSAYWCQMFALGPSWRKALGTVFPQASLGRPCPGACKWATVETATLAGAVGALFLAWLATDGWALNDVIAGCTAVTMIAVLRLPSLRVATILLSGLFFYDVFWVFVSPYIFGDNVMVAAATSAADNPMQEAAEALHIPGADRLPKHLDLPLKLMVPALETHSGRQFYMLGLGDVCMPGLLIYLAFAHDLAISAGRGAGRSGTWSAKGLRDTVQTFSTFASMLAAYVVSLLMAFAMSIAFEAAQPALLYLVPILLGTFVSMALRQGELMAAWEGSYGQQWTRQTAGEEHALIPDADSSPRGMGAV